ncbi:MarR family winged helix-turn-helix transcriptional regulator [Ruicaihuangia caeni]|uniref:MarR family transcriptional regulator n=1 Tax=Ruicaihuangia caeni TaxID=3042517 RepID=A0AAW6T702_9MICO|nr:MarR family transcriptional regulator [Klugiella sp. YN-L-19]MDI2098866.1 MarR family transcriptional regulator [Klugiella sp. YN-L-19]
MAYSSHVAKVLEHMHDPRLMDPDGSLLELDRMPGAEQAEIADVMRAMMEWKLAEAEQSKASSKYMALSEREMRAIRFILAGHRCGVAVTPAMLSEYLEITSAATTKLLDRLEAGGHTTRSPHPTDRRAITLAVTEETRRDARDHVGVSHARRFQAAARLSSEERQIVVRFLRDLAHTSGDS